MSGYVSTVAELRFLHVVSSRSYVIHHPMCANVRRTVRGHHSVIARDPRYWRGELRPGECCGPIVPATCAPQDAPGYAWSRAGVCGLR